MNDKEQSNYRRAISEAGGRFVIDKMSGPDGFTSLVQIDSAGAERAAMLLAHDIENGLKRIYPLASDIKNATAFPDCECSTWERVNPQDLRMGQHHTACPKWKPSYYVRVKLEGGGSYTLPLDDLGALQTDLQEAAADGDTKATFTVTLVDMTPYEYEQLPEFTGH